MLVKPLVDYLETPARQISDEDRAVINKASGTDRLVDI